MLRVATADVFQSWLTALTADLSNAGVAAPDARPLALSTLTLLEGAFLLSRALRSTEPMEASAAAALAGLSAALPSATTKETA